MVVSPRGPPTAGWVLGAATLCLSLRGTPIFRKEAGMSRRSARRLVATAMASSLLLLNGPQARSDDTVETIVLVRHGEKPNTERPH